MKRLIPCMLLKGEGLVKTRRFKSPVYVGDPINIIRIFNEKEVDELMVLDISVSRENREPNFKLIEKFASECFMPLTYGGGIKTVDQAQALFSIGVEKVSIQTGAYDDLSLISKISNKFGNQSVIVSIDVNKTIFGKFKIRNSGFNKSKIGDWLDFAKNAVTAGAGEVLINAVHKDGTLAGPDLSLIQTAASKLPVPLIYAGGVSSLNDIKSCMDSGASAVGAGAFFVFNGPYRAVLVTYPSSEDLRRINRGHDGC